MSIGEQFAGLDMESLIGGPLKAAADASMSLEKSMADYNNKLDEMKQCEKSEVPERRG